MSRRAVIFLIVAGLLALALGLWLAPRGDARVRIAGEGGALPRAQAESEFVLEAALDAARTQAVQMGAKAFIVHRRGHRIFDYFGDGHSGTDAIDGGALGAVLLQLALHQPEDLQADAAQVAALVGERIWLPLRAADAWLRDAEPATARSCCIEARVDDWMRVADLLNGQGTYLGERIVSADAVRAVLAEHRPQTGGDEPLLAREGTAFDLQPGVRIWLAPRRSLTMLVWADEEVARDTLLPNLILRGLNDASPAISGDISDLVPGH